MALPPAAYLGGGVPMFAPAGGRVPFGVSASTVCGSTCASLADNSAGDIPALAASCAIVWSPKVWFTCSEVIGGLGPCATHWFASPPGRGGGGGGAGAGAPPGGGGGGGT